MAANIFYKKHWRKLQHFPDRTLHSPNGVFQILHISACTNAAIAFKHIKRTTMSFWVFTVKTIVRFYYSAGFMRIEFTGFFPSIFCFLSHHATLSTRKLTPDENERDWICIYFLVSFDIYQRTYQTNTFNRQHLLQFI